MAPRMEFYCNLCPLNDSMHTRDHAFIPLKPPSPRPRTAHERYTCKRCGHHLDYHHAVWINEGGTIP